MSANINTYLKKIVIITQPEAVDTTGGAITSFINISDYLSTNYSVKRVCYSTKEGKPKVKDSVNFLNLYKYYQGVLDYSESLNKFIEEINPDLIIFFFPNLYAQANLNVKFNSIPRMLLFRSRPDFYFKYFSEIEDELKKQYINTTAQILFPSYKKLLPDFIKNGPVVYIANPTKQDLQYIDISKEKKRIIYLSRIDSVWKGHDFLLKSFSLIAKKYPDWSLDIYGQSQPPKKEEELKEYAKFLGIEKQVNFCGITKEPFKTYLNYDFCVFPSYFEGFPLGLAEAMSTGLPAIGFREASGVNELIKDNINGFLCEENYEDFAQKIEILIVNKKLRTEFSKSAIKEMQKYSAEKIFNKWETTVQRILNGEEVNDEELLMSKESDVKIFPVEKIIKMENTPISYKFLDRIFSIKNCVRSGVKRKIISIFGIKITLKRKRKKING